MVVVIDFIITIIIVIGDCYYYYRERVRGREQNSLVTHSSFGLLKMFDPRFPINDFVTFSILVQ